MATRPPRVVSALYRAILHVQPRAARGQFGAEQMRLFADLWREECPTGGVAAAMWTAGQLWRALRAGVGLRIDRLARRWPQPAPDGRRPRPGGFGVATDVVYALRSLLRARWFTAGAVLTFALGMGATIAVFSVVDRMMFRPLPYGDAGRLVQIGDQYFSTPDARLPQAVLVTLKAEASSFEGMAYVSGTLTRPVPGSSEPPLSLTLVSYNLLSVLRVHPILGRDFTRADAQADAATRNRQVILTYAAWQSRFGGAADALTKPYAGCRLIGILPRGFLVPAFHVGDRTDGLVVHVEVSPPQGLGSMFTAPVARLRPGVTPARAQAEADTIVTRLGQQMPAVARLPAPWVLPLQFGLFASVRPYAWLILAAVAMVLLVACANLSTLLVARGRSREREIAVRAALGASRRRLVATNLTESVVLCTVSAAVAMLLAVTTRTALVNVLPTNLRGFGESPLDPRVLVFTLSVAIVAAALAGAGPALRATRVDTLSVLQRGASDSRRRLGGGRTLLGLQAALCSALVLGAAVTVHSFLGLLLRPTGFDSQNLYALAVYTPQPAGRTPPTSYEPERVRAILDVVRPTPGVETAGAVTLLPIGYHAIADPFWKARNLHGGEWGVGAGFFAAMGTPVLAGREFSESEIATRALVAIVSASAARELWPGERPVTAVGRSITTADGPRTVVGVVADLRPLPASDPEAALYVPVTAGDAPHPLPWQWLTLVARLAPGGRLDDAQLQRRLSDAFGPTALRVEAVDAQLAPWLQAPRFQAVVFGSVAAIGLILAAAGLYALAAFEAARRRYEMGVRLALGASARDLRRLIIGGTIRPVVIGTALGLAAAWWAVRLLRAFVFAVDVYDPWTFGLVAVVLFATAAAAAWAPARRAGQIDPAAVLRAQ